MKIDKLHLQDFGQFHDKDITLAPGMNIICGANEAGKTTTKDFIVGMLYGMEDPSDTTGFAGYEKRKPINGEGYAGSMEVKTEQGEFLVERNFLRTQKSLAVKDLDTGREITPQNPDTLVGTLIQTDKSTYMNTLCVGQMELATDRAIADKLNDYIVNMASTRAGDVDAVHAIDELRQKKQEFSNKELEEKEQELTAKLQLDRDFDAEIEAVREEYKQVEASKGKKKEEKLQFTPIKKPSVEEEEPEEAEVVEPKVYKVKTKRRVKKK